MGLTVPITKVEVQVNPKNRWYSCTTYCARVYFSDGRLSESSFGGNLPSLRKDLELKYGELITTEFFPFLYKGDWFTVYKYPAQYTDND